MTSPWTPEIEQRLRELWLDGNSAGKIAAALGTSRGSVMGKIHRLGLTSRATTIRFAANYETRMKAGEKISNSKKKRKPRKLDAVQFPTEPLPAADPNERGFYKLVDLPDDGCRYIPHTDHMMCGAKQVPGFPYCERHTVRCYHVEKPREHRSETVFAPKKLSLVV